MSLEINISCAWCGQELKGGFNPDKHKYEIEPCMECIKEEIRKDKLREKGLLSE